MIIKVTWFPGCQHQALGWHDNQWTDNPEGLCPRCRYERGSMEIKRVIDESLSTWAYFTKGHVSRLEFGIAMVDFMNGSEDAEERWDGDPPDHSEVHHDYWRINAQAPGAPWPFTYAQGTRGRQGSFPVTYFCSEGRL